MAANTSPIFALSANLTEVTFVNADGTSAKTIFTAATDGSVLRHINVHSDDTSIVTMDLIVNDGSTDYTLGAIDIPIGAGTDGAIPAVDMMDGALIPGLGAPAELFLKTGYSVKVAPQGAVTATFTVTVVAVGIDY